MITPIPIAIGFPLGDFTPKPPNGGFEDWLMR